MWNQGSKSCLACLHLQPSLASKPMSFQAVCLTLTGRSGSRAAVQVGIPFPTLHPVPRSLAQAQRVSRPHPWFTEVHGQ